FQDQQVEAGEGGGLVPEMGISGQSGNGGGHQVRVFRQPAGQGGGCILEVPGPVACKSEPFFFQYSLPAEGGAGGIDGGQGHGRRVPCLGSELAASQSPLFLQ